MGLINEQRHAIDRFDLLAVRKLNEPKRVADTIDVLRLSSDRIALCLYCKGKRFGGQLCFDVELGCFFIAIFI